MATKLAADGNAKPVTRIDVIPAARGKHACFLAGKFIAKDELAACRVLAELGIVGTVETWREGDAFPSMRIDIETGAKLVVSETEKHGPRFAAYRPFPTDDRLPINRTTTQTEIVAGGMHPSG